MSFVSMFIFAWISFKGIDFSKFEKTILVFSVSFLFGAIVLLLLTKGSKNYGSKIKRFSSLLFILCFLGIIRLLNSFKMLPYEEPKWCNDLLITEPSYQWIINLLFIVVGILGYFFGKYISKKVENYNKLV